MAHRARSSFRTTTERRAPPAHKMKARAPGGYAGLPRLLSGFSPNRCQLAEACRRDAGYMNVAAPQRTARTFCAGSHGRPRHARIMAGPKDCASTPVAGFGGDEKANQVLGVDDKMVSEKSRLAALRIAMLSLRSLENWRRPRHGLRQYRHSPRDRRDQRREADSDHARA